MKSKVIQGDNIDILKTYPDNHFDSIVTDPPYGIEFLGKDWDSNTGAVETWAECYRVLKPGGYILAFSAARTYHNLATNIEGVGFEIRDQLMWLYASGFPKAQDIGKAIDKRMGKKDPKFKGTETFNLTFGENPGQRLCAVCKKDQTAVYKCDRKDCGQQYQIQTPEAQQWSGWKTALKPAHEPIVMARKPFKGSAIDNVLTHGTGALNIDATRIEMSKEDAEKDSKWRAKWEKHSIGGPTFQGTDINEQRQKKAEHEPIIMARKPFKGSAIDNVLKYGVGALNIDATRVEYEDTKDMEGAGLNWKKTGYETGGPRFIGSGEENKPMAKPEEKGTGTRNINTQGRYPSNVIGEVTDYQKFFYCPKVSRSERHIGFEAPEPEQGIYTMGDALEELGGHWEKQKTNYKGSGSVAVSKEGNIIPQSTLQTMVANKGIPPNKDYMVEAMGGHWEDNNICFIPHLGKIYVHGLKHEYDMWCKANNVTPPQVGNNHPTVKPVALMKYLIKLVTPAGGKVLDPFTGSGSTGMAAVELDYDFTGCELDADYVNIANNRITAWKNKTDLNNKPLPEEWFNEET